MILSQITMKQTALSKKLKINCPRVVRQSANFLKRKLKERNKTRAVLEISGGVDSAVAAILCDKAGTELHLVYLPYGKLSKRENITSEGKLKIPLKGSASFFERDITESVDLQFKDIGTMLALDRIDKGNIMARQRMIVEYALARKLNALVVGTENLSEYYLGYFTLHGDQACDINPIAGLFKTQVMELAKYLRVPSEILNQKPSADLYEGQTDEGELGFSYEEADPILYLYCVRGLNPRKIIKDFGLDADLVNRVVARVKATNFKRESVPKYEIY